MDKEEAGLGISSEVTFFGDHYHREKISELPGTKNISQYPTSPGEPLGVAKIKYPRGPSGSME